MPINVEYETFYSVQELSQILHTTDEEVIALLTSGSFRSDEIQGRLHLNKGDLEKFFDHYFAVKGISDDRQYRIPKYLKSSPEPWANTLSQMYEKKVNCPASISPEQGEFLKSLVANINPSTVVEIGCFTGVSTIWMAAGLEQIASSAVIHAIDLFDEILPWMPTRHGCLLDPYSYATERVAEAQLSHRIKFHKMNSIEAGHRLDQIVDRPIDFLFIDGDHTRQGCLTDWMLFYPQVSVGGYIVLHDIYPEHCGWEGPRYVLDECIKNNHQFAMTEIKTSPCNFGMAIVQKLADSPVPSPSVQQIPLMTKLLKKLSLQAK
ncbi:O-methyltransferase [Leptolyngbya sp. NIES-2104]|uniref:O-methyltransferase n=1 Tax=Leptolyngbya sp. NIES-2104 TaxID=1552121 RepID=UPI0006ECCB83|nr:class I SAM-dependent methyltransferase [Leptolyngbya sp. NIES-2104]GAP98477.1 hypothetical protein NIES2104_50320 [Leptolyngbya sp. NIES-2104]